MNRGDAVWLCVVVAILVAMFVMANPADIGLARVTLTDGTQLTCRAAVGACGRLVLYPPGGGVMYLDSWRSIERTEQRE